MSTEDGPTFLSSPPSAPPEPTSANEPRAVVLQAPPPYRSPGTVAPERSTAPRVRRPSAEPEPSPSPDLDEPTRGDRAGEHHAMTRGRYSAWTYVVIAFGFETGLLAIVPYLALHAVLARFTASDTPATAIALGVGAVTAWRVFHDRWRCIEAFTSRFCSGLMNLSILYVPFVALIYANVRGVGKWRQG